MTTAETGGSVEVHLGGFTVMRCVVDYAFSLDLARPEAAVRGQQWASVRIGGPFDYVVEDTTRRLDAAECPEELGPALRLFRQTVESATITPQWHTPDPVQWPSLSPDPKLGRL